MENKEWYQPSAMETNFIKKNITGFAIGVMVVITFGAIWQTISLNKTVEELGRAVQNSVNLSINVNNRATNNEKQLNGVVGFLNNAIKQANGNGDN